MGSTIGQIFKVNTYGESHGEALGCVIENCPAGLEITEQEIQKELNRRKPGQSKITTPRYEADKVKITSGVFEGKTLGTPIHMIVYNENAKSKDYSDFKNVYRPSHADFTYDAKYGHRTYLGGGRSSARSTIGIVAAGAIAKKILSHKMDVQLVAFVRQVYNLQLNKNFSMPILDIQKYIEQTTVRCPDLKLAVEIEKLIQKTRQEGDSLGGVIELYIDNLVSGLGNPVFDKLDALLAYAMLYIPATKGVEFGSGFSSSNMKGSEHNDLFEIRNQDKSSSIRTKTNFSGGIQGGISNGERISLRIAFKPTATISKEQTTVNSKKEIVNLKVRGRHDPCVLPRAVPIVEAMAALILVDQYLLSKLNKYDLL